MNVDLPSNIIWVQEQVWVRISVNTGAWLNLPHGPAWQVNAQLGVTSASAQIQCFPVPTKDLIRDLEQDVGEVPFDLLGQALLWMQWPMEIQSMG